MNTSKLKVKTKMFFKKIVPVKKNVAIDEPPKEHNVLIPILQFALIVLILLPFSYLKLTGWNEVYYVIFALFLFSGFILLNSQHFTIILVLSVILFLIAGIIYINSLSPVPYNPHNPWSAYSYKSNIINPLTNFFLFFSFVFFMPTITAMFLGTGRISIGNLLMLMFGFFFILIVLVVEFILNLIGAIIGDTLENHQKEQLRKAEKTLDEKKAELNSLRNKKDMLDIEMAKLKAHKK